VSQKPSTFRAGRVPALATMRADPSLHHRLRIVEFMLECLGAVGRAEWSSDPQQAAGDLRIY
jgi:hypothetical protein